MGSTLGDPLAQPHCPPCPPQAKSVEEKRVWTHHIKRLILENHHAIIPQKVRAEGDGHHAGTGVVPHCPVRRGQLRSGFPPHLFPSFLHPRLRKPSWRWTCSVSAAGTPRSPPCPCLSPPRPPASPPVPADPPRLPRCSPERLKKSWSCQPLGDIAAEPRQGRRQSGESRTAPASPPPPSLPRGKNRGWVAPMPVGTVGTGCWR